MKMIGLTRLALTWALATTIHAQSYKVLVNFNEKPSEPDGPGVIAQSRGGYLLTTSPDYQPYDNGSAFRVSTSGVLAVLHEFAATDGDAPAGGLTLGRNGRFYGTTAYGGTNSSGTIFEMTPDGIIKTLHEFENDVDGYPLAAPVQSLYGDFYATTTGDDAHPGTVYKINSDGGFILLHAFTGTDGAFPLAPLVQDATNHWF